MQLQLRRNRKRKREREKEKEKERNEPRDRSCGGRAISVQHRSPWLEVLVVASGNHENRESSCQGNSVAIEKERKKDRTQTTNGITAFPLRLLPPKASNTNGDAKVTLEPKELLLREN